MGDGFTVILQFLSTPSVGEGDGCKLRRPPLTPAYFYPRPPWGGRHLLLDSRGQRFFISIHALRGEGD